MPASESSKRTSKRRGKRRSRFQSGSSPPGSDGEAAGKVLAEEYPETMQRVTSGFRRGAEEVQKTADPAGGQDR